jgi:hypothetical protein
MPPITAVSPLFTEICVVTLRVSIEGTWKPPPRLTIWPDRVLAHLDGHDDPVVRGDLRHDREAQHGLLELHGRRIVGAPGRHVRNFRALLDVRLLVVAGDHARARHDLASIVGFERESSRLIRLPLPRLMSVSARLPAAFSTGKLTLSCGESE